jgi:hypothetical protein
MFLKALTGLRTERFQSSSKQLPAMLPVSIPLPALFTGHFTVGLAALWPGFTMTGIECVRTDPGKTVTAV